MSLQVEVAEIREDCADMASEPGVEKGGDGHPFSGAAVPLAHPLHAGSL